MTTQTFTDELVVITCCNCGMTFGLNAAFHRGRRNDHEWWYCPAGHVQHFTGPTEAQKERKRREKAENEAEAARRERNAAREQRDAARQLAKSRQRSAAAYKGHLTRAKNRITNGACPVPGCKRTGFDRVMSHIASQHPDWLHEHPEVAHPEGEPA